MDSPIQSLANLAIATAIFNRTISSESITRQLRMWRAIGFSNIAVLPKGCPAKVFTIEAQPWRVSWSFDKHKFNIKHMALCYQNVSDWIILLGKHKQISLRFWGLYILTHGSFSGKYIWFILTSLSKTRLWLSIMNIENYLLTEKSVYFLIIKLMPQREIVCCTSIKSWILMRRWMAVFGIPNYYR